jgi:hypothetical protein
MIWMRTRVSPAPKNPSRFAASLETSRMRLRGTGPRSFTLRMSVRWFRRLVTLILVPSGSSRWAHVSAFSLKGTPLAVGFPWNSGPYQLATPYWVLTVEDEDTSSIPSWGGLASDRADKATRAATAQPRTRFLIQPPSSLSPASNDISLAHQLARFSGSIDLG